MKGYRALVGMLAVTALALAPACRKTAEGAKEDSRQDAEKVRQEAQEGKEEGKDTAHKIGEEAKETGSKVGEKTKDVGGQVAEGAKDVGEAVKAGAKEVASEVGAQKQTVDVKAHLMADKSIDASHIDVDTDSGAKTVTLRGTVPTAAQKAAAEKVARKKAEGYQVRNLLTVAEK